MPGLAKIPKSDMSRMHTGTRRGWSISTGERTGCKRGYTSGRDESRRERAAVSGLHVALMK